MKNLLTRMLTPLALAVLLLAGVAHAQYAQRIVKVTVPFDFTVAGKAFAAGEYSIVRVAPNRLDLRDAQSSVRASLITHAVESDNVPAVSRLDFSSQDGGHALTRVWLEHERIGYELARPKTATVVARQRPAAVQTIVSGSQP